MKTDSDTPLRLDVHGARGSAAVSGRSFVRHGGNTTCYAITLPDGHRVIVDCGSGLGRLEAGLGGGEDGHALEATVFFTHFHWDHIQGLPLFGPLHSPSTRLRLIATPPPGLTIAEALNAVLRPPWFPVRFQDAPAQITFEPLQAAPVQIGPLQVRGVPLRHPGGVTGYRLAQGDRSIVIATDVEAGAVEHDAALLALADGASVLVHDAQYTPAEYEAKRRGWGHSTWEHAAQAAAHAGVARLLLTSHAPTRTDEEVDAIVASARTIFSATEAAFEGQSIDF